MSQLVVGPGRDNPELMQAVRERARVAIQKALDEGKQGNELRFGGAPWLLHIEWPAKFGKPPYPTRGVWHAGSYWGDDG